MSSRRDEPPEPRRQYGGRAIREALADEAKTLPTWVDSAERVQNEGKDRARLVSRALPFYHSFLDDCLRAMLPNDLIVFGAETGIGKSELVQQIAVNNAIAGKRVNLYALEAEAIEAERRMKFRMLARLAYQAGRETRHLNYGDWYLNRCEHIVGDLESEAEYELSRMPGRLRTMYRKGSFDGNMLKETLLGLHEETDLIGIDHFHYVDSADENVNRAQDDLIKLLRDIVLEICIPIMLVVHLRKAAMGVKRLVPGQDDVHGSSNIAKVCTRIVMTAPAYKHDKSPRHAGTYMHCPKDRLNGATGMIALCQFDRVLRMYGADYTLGRPKMPGDIFEPLDTNDVPPWAKHHVPMHPGSQDGTATPTPTDADAPPAQATIFE